RGQDLVPVARISTARQRLLLLDSTGGPLAEVACDDVIAQPMAGLAGVSRWHEIEVELTGGSADLINAADKLLQRNGLSRAGQFAKLARALDLPPPEPRPRPPPGPAAAAGERAGRHHPAPAPPPQARGPHGR